MHTQDNVDKLLTSAGLEVYLSSPEPEFAGIQNEWYSPGENVELTDDLTILFEYAEGSIIYIGETPRKFLFIGTESISTSSGIGVPLEFALGKNGNVETKSIQQTESLLSGAPKEITSQKVFSLSHGDSLDFFVRQISSANPQPINLIKGVWTVIIIPTI